MKNILLSILVISLFISCKSNTKQPAIADSASATKPKVDNSKALIAEFMPIIQGVWVKSSYIDKVIRTRSPLAADDEAKGLMTVIIDKDNMKGDSIVVPAGWNNHEGSNLTLYFQPGKRKSTILFGEGELGYKIENGDTILTIYRPSENDKNKIITTNYKRVFKQNHDELGAGTYYLINKALVAGNYSFADSVGTVSKVNFIADGKITGFFNFKTYNINVDLNSDVMDNLDEIRFETDNKTYKSYSFKLDADTLKLYDTKPNADSSELVLDKLRYKLVRVK